MLSWQAVFNEEQNQRHIFHITYVSRFITFQAKFTNIRLLTSLGNFTLNRTSHGRYDFILNFPRSYLAFLGIHAEMSLNFASFSKVYWNKFRKRPPKLLSFICTKESDYFCQFSIHYFK